jgi:aryl-phospho-beta-D-glucosidase BglC (GH1 family)
MKINPFSVTYADHFTGSSPDWTIDAEWLSRVEEVVDLALERDLYVVTNVHHGREPETNYGWDKAKSTRFLGMGGCFSGRHQLDLDRGEALPHLGSNR